MENMGNILAILAIIGLIIVSGLAILKPQDQTKQTMSVSGNSELSVSPDEAVIYINVITEADTADKAQSDNKATSLKVTDALKKVGIKDSDIETSNYYLNKNQIWNQMTQKYDEKGYILTHTMKVTTTDVENVGKYIDAAVSAGANGIDRITFDLTKATEKDVRSQALTAATVAAKEKAQSIAQTAGIKMGKITSIQESNFYYTPYEYNVGMNIAPGAAKMDSVNSISPQKVSVTSSIQLIFEIN
jgi:uncharacterized protein